MIYSIFLYIVLLFLKLKQFDLILRDNVMVFTTTFDNISAISWRSLANGGRNRSTRRKLL